MSTNLSHSLHETIRLLFISPTPMPSISRSVTKWCLSLFNHLLTELYLVTFLPINIKDKLWLFSDCIRILLYGKRSDSLVDFMSVAQQNSAPVEDVDIFAASCIEYKHRSLIILITDLGKRFAKSNLVSCGYNKLGYLIVNHIITPNGNYRFTNNPKQISLYAKENDKSLIYPENKIQKVN